MDLYWVRVAAHAVVAASPNVPGAVYHLRERGFGEPQWELTLWYRTGDSVAWSRFDTEDDGRQAAQQHDRGYVPV